MFSEIKATPLEWSAASDSAELREYGPEFSAHVDDLDLPHIDPRLATNPQPALAPPAAPSEALFAKLYQAYEPNDANRLPIINTDIF